MTGALILVAFGLVSLMWGLAGKARVAIEESQMTKRQYEALQDRKGALEEKLAELVTVRGQDAAVRTAFGVARPGEEVIVVVPPATTAPTSTPSWWQRLWSWF